MEESRCHTYRWRRVYRRAPDECAIPPLDIRVRAMQLSPYRAGVAGPCHTRLLTSPAFQPCCCSLALSGLGEAVASESSALNSGLFRRQFLPCVTWRTLSPHTAQHLWSVSMDLHEASVPISPAPQYIPRGQLARALGTCGPIFPKARGLRPQSSSWCAQLSWAPTPMPHPTPVRPSGVSLGSRFPTLHFPSHASQVSRVHHEGLKQNAVGGVLLNAPSPLWGSPIFLQGSLRLTWSPIHYHPRE